MSSVDQFVTEALKSGHSMNDIVNDLSKSEDPEEKAWAQKWMKNSQNSDRMSNFIAQGEKENATAISNFQNEISGGLTVPDWMKSPEGLLISGAALKGGFEVGKAVGKVGGSLIDRMFTNKPAEPKTTFSPPTNVGPILDVTATPKEYQEALGPNWQTILERSEAARKEKQAIAQQRAQQSMSTSTPNPTVPGGVPPNSIYPGENRIPQMMAGQEMRNPLGGLASAYTEPIRPPVTPPSQSIGTNEIPTIAQLGQQATGTAPVAPPETTKQIATETIKGKKIGRPTIAEAEAKAAAQAAFVPPPQAQKIPENWGKGMGWLVGAYGVEGAQDFINRYNNGKPFESYADFTKKYEQLIGKTAGSVGEIYGPTFGAIPKEVRKERGIVPSAPQFKKEAGFAIPQPIPGKQTGSGSLGAILGSLASGGLLYAASTPEAQAAMQRASGAVRDIGISPDIFQGKGEELGRLGSAYVTAGNPQYRQQLLQQINVERDPVRYNMLLSEFAKAGGNVAGGRGVAPPPR